MKYGIPAQVSNVLLLEDNSIDSEYLSREIQKIAYPCPNLIRRQSLSEIESDHDSSYDLVFLDLNLADSVGLDTFKAVQKKFNNCPVVIVSGQENGEVEVQAKKLGAREYLVKGKYDSQKLIGALEHCFQSLIDPGSMLHEIKRYRQLMGAMEFGIIDWDFTDNSIYFNNHWFEILRFSPSEFPSTPNAWFAKIKIEDKRMFVGKLTRFFQSRENSLSAEFRMTDKYGDIHWISFKGSLSRNSSGKPMRMVAGVFDITNQKSTEIKLIHEIFKDGLTNIPNRLYFFNELKNKCRRLIQKEIKSLAVLFLDLDNFKQVNDKYGHEMGDKFLIEISHRIQSVLSPKDIFARMGGDEFSVLSWDMANETEAQNLALKISSEFNKPVRIGSLLLKTDVSIGIRFQKSIRGDLGRCAEEILRDADNAMYRAKFKKNSRIELFSPETSPVVFQSALLGRKLDSALGSGGIYLEYQPVAHSKTNKFIGLEAYLRWEDPVLGAIHPEKLLELIRLNNKEWEFAKFVFEKACAEISLLDAFSQEPLWIFLNFELEHLAVPGLLDSFLSSAKLYNMDPGRLVFEVTETSKFAQGLDRLKVLQPYSQAGFRVAVDDFGSGYWSLRTLEKIPVTFLKIDMYQLQSSFVEGDNHLAFSGYLLPISEEKHFQIIAKGVEKEYQLQLIRNYGIAYYQGFLLQAPARLDNLRDFVKRNWLEWEKSHKRDNPSESAA